MTSVIPDESAQGGRVWSEPKPLSDSERAAKGIVRLSVNINRETAEAIRALAESNGISVTEVIRRAVSVYKFIDDEVKSGRNIKTMDESDNNVREITIL